MGRDEHNKFCYGSQSGVGGGEGLQHQAPIATSHIQDTVQEYAPEQQKARNEHLLGLLKFCRLSPVSKLYLLLGGWKQILHDVIELHTHMVADQSLEAHPGKTTGASPWLPPEPPPHFPFLPPGCIQPSPDARLIFRASHFCLRLQESYCFPALK